MLLSCLLVPAFLGFLGFLLYGMATVERLYLRVPRPAQDRSVDATDPQRADPQAV